MSPISPARILRQFACVIGVGVALMSFTGCGLEVGAVYPGIGYEEYTHPTNTSPRLSQSTSRDAPHTGMATGGTTGRNAVYSHNRRRVGFPIDRGILPSSTMSIRRRTAMWSGPMLQKAVHEIVEIGHYSL